jgi:hypothetical protein
VEENHPQTAEKQLGPEEILRADIAALTHDPYKFAKYAYAWGEGELAGSKGPRKWQRSVLESIGYHLQSKARRHQPCLIAVASGKGIGKSALVAMIINWGMSTCEDCKVVVTANTGTQLATKTVPEVAKWTRLSINKHWWNSKATSVTSLEPGHEREWRADFIPWSKENMEAFSGLHNMGKRMIVIFDEASGIHDTIWDNTEGTLTDANTEIIWIAFGNPTQPYGRFRECFGKSKHIWQTWKIDSRTVEGTNHEEQARQVREHGEDSYHVRIWIRGEFPLVGSDQFIAPDVVATARQTLAEGYEHMPKIIGCDVARFGDDQTVIGYRQGRRAVVLEKLRGKDTVYVAERVIYWQEQERAQAVVVDGDGLGAGVVDQIKARGYGRRLFEFRGGMTANDQAKYRNRRAEVWGMLREWLPGASLPDDDELCEDLGGPLYEYNAKGQICLEQKEDMKSRGLASPDCGDMLAMTFGVTVAAPKPVEKTELVYVGLPNTGWMA